MTFVRSGVVAYSHWLHVGVFDEATATVGCG